MAIRRLPSRVGGTRTRAIEAARYPAATAAGFEDGATIFDDLVGLLRRHKWLILLGGLIGAAAAIYQVRQEVPMYRAAAVIRLVDTANALTSGLGSAATATPVGATDPLLSQLQFFQARSFALDLVDRSALRLRSLTDGFGHADLMDVRIDPAFPEDTLQLRFGPASLTASVAGQGIEAGYGEPIELEGLRFAVPARPSVGQATVAIQSRETGANRFLGGIRSRTRERTNVVDIEYVDQDPVLAQRVVNEAVTLFQEESAIAAQQQSRRRRVFLETQVAQTDSILADAQFALAAFRTQQQVLSPSEQLVVQQQAMLDLDLRRNELQADREMYASLLRGIEAAPPGSAASSLATVAAAPGIAGNAVVTRLYQQLTDYERQRNELTTGEPRLSESHPDVARLDELRRGTRTELMDAVRSHIAIQDARLASLEDLEARGGENLRGLPELEAREARLSQQVGSMTRLADQLREEHQRARIAEAVEAGQVEIVDLAVGAGTRIPPGDTRKVFLGLMVGLFAGGGGAYLIERMNSSVNRREDLEELLDIPALAVIPAINRRRIPREFVDWVLGHGQSTRMHRDAALAPDGFVDPTLVTARDSLSPGAEAYRTLRTNLLFQPDDEELRSIVITSALTQEGKTTTAANLAMTFAQQGIKVLLIDCDLRRPRIEALFGIPRAPGITDLLAGDCSAQAALHGTPLPDLDLLPCGEMPSNPSELLGSRKVRELIQLLGKRYEMILIDTPPLLAAADAAILGTIADGVVLVVRAGQTERAALATAVHQLDAVGANIVGSVLNDPDEKIPGYSSYSYYQEYYGSEGKV